MYNKQIIGKKGEEIASNYLMKNGYEIINRNFKCKQGEIDIIAQDNNEKEIVFVEVKTRTNLKCGTPAEAVNLIKQKHIERAIEYYIYINKLYNVRIRVDVIEIFMKREGRYLKGKINHIKQIL